MIYNIRYMHINGRVGTRKLGRKSQNQIGTDFETPGKSTEYLISAI